MLCRCNSRYTDNLYTTRGYSNAFCLWPGLLFKTILKKSKIKCTVVLRLSIPFSMQAHSDPRPTERSKFLSGGPKHCQRSRRCLAHDAWSLRAEILEDIKCSHGLGKPLNSSRWRGGRLNGTEAVSARMMGKCSHDVAKNVYPEPKESPRSEVTSFNIRQFHPHKLNLLLKLVNESAQW